MDFGRVITAMVTPFDENLNVNHDVLSELANNLIAHGSDSLVVCGTTGESPTLSKSEKIEMFETVVNAVKGKVPVIAGTGSYSTKDSIELSKEAERVGAQGLLLVVPYYNKPPQYALYEHFKAIAEAVHLPIILYNVPGRTVRNMEPETVIKLSEIDNIVGIKEAAGDMDQVTAIKAGVDDDFRIYSGDDSMTLPMLSVGGYGVVSVCSHLVGNDIKKMISAYVEGKVQQAASLHLKLFKLFKTMFITTNPMPLKYALNLTGWDVGGYRPPMYEIQENHKEAVKSVLDELNLI
ncbi:MAG: 4-hydroxy-tetrahydrodipicolinate synthase [Clostridia bacterium]|nr:4-hydroxy-tetrahydrodipicolinate synthase [Clostridia bacterium]